MKRIVRLATINLSCLNTTKQVCLKNTIEIEKLDIICVQETHFGNNNIDKFNNFKSLFNDFEIHNSYNIPSDNYGGIITLIKKKNKFTFLNFEELIQGRLSNTKIEIGNKIYNIINWYGDIGNKIKLDNSLAVLADIVKSCSLHGEHLLIMGDFNLTTLKEYKQSFTKHDTTFCEWIKEYKLYDKTTTNPGPSYRNGTATSRPDHILSNFYTIYPVKDIDLNCQHKMIRANINYIHKQKQFKNHLQKTIIMWNDIKNNMETINKEITVKLYKDIEDIQTHFKSIIERYTKTCKEGNNTITDNSYYKKLTKVKYHLEAKKQNQQPLPKITEEFISKNYEEYNNIQDYIHAVNRDMERFIIQKIQERKEKFDQEVNDLRKKTPFSHAFRQEMQRSSIFEVVKEDNFEDVIVDHYEKMFNNELGSTDITDPVKHDPSLNNWQLQELSIKEFKKIIHGTKNSMSGYDNISVKFLKACPYSQSNKDCLCPLHFGLSLHL